MRAEGGRQAGPQEAGQAPGGGRVGVEAAGPGGDLAAADVLGGLERGARPHREAVEARVVHPDPDREPADREGARVGGREVAELLLGDHQRQPRAELGEQLVGPGVDAQQQPRGAPGAAGGPHLDGIPEIADLGHRGLVQQAGAVVDGQALEQLGPPGGRDHATVGLPEPAGPGLQAEHRPAAQHLGGVQPLVGHAAGVQAGEVGARWDGGAQREQVQAAGADHQPLPRLPLQVRPGPVGQAGQVHVGRGVVGAADDARVVVGGAAVVAEPELLQPEHAGAGRGQGAGGGAAQRPQPDHDRVEGHTSA